MGRESLTARAECLRECRERVDEGWSLGGSFGGEGVSRGLLDVSG